MVITQWFMSLPDWLQWIWWVFFFVCFIDTSLHIAEGILKKLIER